MEEEEKVYYGRCLRNHGAWLGRNATDCCCEYAQGVPDSPFCLACDCHKNYHEKAMIKVDAHGHNDTCGQSRRGQLYMNSLATNKLRNASSSRMAKVEKAQESSSRQLEPKTPKTKGGWLSFSCMKVNGSTSSASPAEDA